MYNVVHCRLEKFLLPGDDDVYSGRSLPLAPLSEYHALPPTRPSPPERVLSEMKKKNESFAFAPLKLYAGQPLLSTPRQSPGPPHSYSNQGRFHSIYAAPPRNKKGEYVPRTHYYLSFEQHAELFMPRGFLIADPA